jgi:cell division cycle 2-like protein
LRCGEGDREPCTGDLVAERGVTERAGDFECAERGRLGERVRDRSRVTLRERDRVPERAGDGLREAMSEDCSNRLFNSRSTLL